MEFQQGMTILCAAASGLVGAGFTYGLMKGSFSTEIANLKVNITKLESELRSNIAKVVFTDTCKQCQDKWAIHTVNLKEDISGLSDSVKGLILKLDNVLLHLSHVVHIDTASMKDDFRY